LASIVDTGGWAIRGANAAPSVTMNNDIYVEAQSAVDVLDDNTSIAQSFNQMMAQSSTKVKDEAMERMKTTVFAPTITTQAPESVGMPEFNPYPTDIQQTVIQPLNDPSHMADLNMQPVEQPVYTPAQTQETRPVAATPPAHSSTTTSETPIPADIIKLANNADGLSIETIAHEANRIHKKLEQAEEEVVISLR
jgi:hypothetical protein